MFSVYSVNNGFGAQRGSFETMDSAIGHAQGIAHIQGMRADVRDASNRLVWQCIPFAIVQADKARALTITAIRKAEFSAYRNATH